MVRAYPNSIRQAAELLDKANPKWEKEIDISSLSMQNYSYCILGQLYKGYGKGFMELFDYEAGDLCHDNIFGTTADKKLWINEINSRLGTNFDFAWATNQMAHGHKVQRKNWQKRWIKKASSGIGIFTNLNEIANFAIDDFTAKDWIIYKEPLMFSKLEGGDRFKTAGYADTFTKLETPSDLYYSTDSNWKLQAWSNNIEVELVGKE